MKLFSINHGPTNCNYDGTLNLQILNKNASELYIYLFRFDREERDGGIFIEEGEMNQDFSMNAGKTLCILFYNSVQFKGFCRQKDHSTTAKRLQMCINLKNICDYNSLHILE